jgi:hypothetical protein
MQFFMLIPNIMLILHGNQVLVVKISKYEHNFATFYHILPPISKTLIFSATEQKFFKPMHTFVRCLMTIRLVYEYWGKVFKQKTR